jgi:hypothetical protein
MGRPVSSAELLHIARILTMYAGNQVSLSRFGHAGVGSAGEDVIS